MMCSSLLQHVIEHLRHVEEDLCERMDAKGYKSVQQMQGTMSQIDCADPTAFELAQYIRAVKGPQHVQLTGQQAWRILTGM